MHDTVDFGCSRQSPEAPWSPCPLEPLGSLGGRELKLQSSAECNADAVARSRTWAPRGAAAAAAVDSFAKMHGAADDDADASPEEREAGLPTEAGVRSAHSLLLDRIK